MRTENKGITQFAILDDRPLSDWQVYPLPMQSVPSSGVILSAAKNPGSSSERAPDFLHATFNLSTPADTFLDIRNLDKGVVWINGHTLGRFWNVGPQDTLYVPGPWLKTGANEIVVFDVLPTAHESVTGLDHSILDGPVVDHTTSSQE